MAGYNVSAPQKLRLIEDLLQSAKLDLAAKPSAFAGAVERDELWLSTAASEGITREGDGTSKADAIQTLIEALEYEITGKRSAALKQLDLITHWVECFREVSRQVRQLEAMKAQLKEAADATVTA